MLAVWSILAPSLALAQVADHTPYVFLVGNSYTQSNDLRGILERVAKGGSSLVQASAVPGARLPDHLARLDARTDGTRELEPGAPLWNTLVLQDQSQVPGFPQTESYWQDSAAAAAALDAAAAGSGFDTVLFVTWGRRDGDSMNPEMYPDFETMNARLEAGYRAYADGCTVPGRTMWLAPVHRAFAAVHDQVTAAGDDPTEPGSRFHALYTGDGSHPAIHGSTLAALVLARTITGQSLSADDVDAAGAPLEDADWLVDAALAATQPYGDIDFSWDHRLTDADVGPYGVDDTLELDGLQACQTLLIDAEAEVAAVSLSGCARLWVGAGGTLRAGSLAADEAAEIDVQDGVLDVEQWAGTVAVSGGELVAGAAGGALWLASGTLSLSVVDAETPALSLTGASTLGGTVLVDAVGDARSLQLVAAPSLLIEDGLDVQLPEGWVVSVDTVDGRDVLLASLGEDTDSAEEDGEPDAGDDPGTEDPTGGASSSDKGGCAAVSGGLGLVGLGLSLVAVAGRRR